MPILYLVNYISEEDSKGTYAADLDTTCHLSLIQTQELIESFGSLSANPRLDKIFEKHRKRFQWIWSDREDGPCFAKWLRSGDPIYWITGLPGSGKSTLMKYIYEDPQSAILTGHQSVIKVGYFFHELGKQQEETFTGLLARVLQQLLTSLNGLAPECLKLFKDLQKR